MSDFVEIAPNRWRFVKPSSPPARSALPCPTGLAGYLHARVRAAAPGVTYYIDPLPVLS